MGLSGIGIKNGSNVIHNIPGRKDSGSGWNGMSPGLLFPELYRFAEYQFPAAVRARGMKIAVLESTVK